MIIVKSPIINYYLITNYLPIINNVIITRDNNFINKFILFIWQLSSGTYLQNDILFIRLRRTFYILLDS